MAKGHPNQVNASIILVTVNRADELRRTLESPVCGSSPALFANASSTGICQSRNSVRRRRAAHHNNSPKSTISRLLTSPAVIPTSLLRRTYLGRHSGDPLTCGRIEEPAKPPASSGQL
jgi:hypothetical protein